MAIPKYSARPLFSQFHLFFHDKVTLSVSILRALSYHELASAALDSDRLSSFDVTDTDEATLCDEPLTRAQLSTFSYTHYKALVSNDLFFVVTKLFSSLREDDTEHNFLQSEPWLSSDSRCLGCGLSIEADSYGWIDHRDTCTGIEDRMLQSVFVQTEFVGPIKLMWNLASFSTGTIQSADIESTYKDDEPPCTPEKLAKTKTLVLDWLSKIE
ncbi:hypothetical protein BDZ89DRAFT_1128829 [Hymenopellis radicata]|nr:hypothetical protein BDZ89DRAFT_1128829 [Hymenopellis radicata]